MEFKFEELDLDGAYEELSGQIRESFGVSDFLISKKSDFDYDSPFRKQIDEWWVENRDKIKKLMSVRKSLRIIRHWDINENTSPVKVLEIPDNRAHIQ